ncbi:hypothetical protein Kisp01_72790 [Kineosporia sp. NBRC 101677]|nr:hypothetical protein Kisp01_72790 [Kineosporia sp. NBRC 101677]
MDNGLIFPYRRRTAHIEPEDTNIVKPMGPSGAGGGALDLNR